MDLWKYEDNPNSEKMEDTKISWNREVNDIVIKIGDKSNVWI